MRKEKRRGETGIAADGARGRGGGLGAATEEIVE